MFLDDHQLAVRLAAEAGELLLAVRERLTAEDAPPSVLKAEGDRQAHELLMRRLAEERPDDAVLSEEGKDDLARLDAERTWIVDPLDGTREFSEVPRTDWAVHVALVADETRSPEPSRCRASASPCTPASPPAPAEGNTPPRMIVSRSRPPAAAARCRGARRRSRRDGFGRCQDDGRHPRRMRDLRPQRRPVRVGFLRPVAVAAAAGCHVSRIDGSKLRYNQRDVYLPDLLVCRPELADAALAALASFAG